MISLKKIPLLILLTVTLVLFGGCNDQTPEAVTNRIEKSDRLGRVNSVCESLPKPPGFTFINKQIRGNARKASLSFAYKYEGSHEKVITFYADWFEKNGWSRDESWAAKFIKDKQEIAIERVLTGSIDYVISCSENI